MLIVSLLAQVHEIITDTFDFNTVLVNVIEMNLKCFRSIFCVSWC